MSVQLFPALAVTVEELQSSFDQIPAERRERLGEIGRYLDACDGAANFIFICTHNSRRSHLAQIWAQTAATVHGVSGVRCFSGGTEATRFDHRAVEALGRAGFEIEAGEPSSNPIHRVRFAERSPALEAFSKLYDADPNPRQNFCAAMTCSDADTNCPIVAGAAARIVIPYDDPKQADGTASETEIYDARCREIGMQMLYAFRR